MSLASHLLTYLVSYTRAVTDTSLFSFSKVISLNEGDPIIIFLLLYLLKGAPPYTMQNALHLTALKKNKKPLNLLWLI